jgi:hypothetical protein
MKGFIYLITMEPDEYVKIGFTRQNPKARLASLQTGCPQTLHLRGYFPGTLDEEKRLHQVFEPLSYRGEWFYVERKLRDFLGYFDDLRDRRCATRERFEDALHDCVMQSMWYPGGQWTQDEYDNSANWEPFRPLLWRAFGPWGE